MVKSGMVGSLRARGAAGEVSISLAHLFFNGLLIFHLRPFAAIYG